MLTPEKKQPRKPEKVSYAPVRIKAYHSRGITGLKESANVKSKQEQERLTGRVEG